MNGIRHFWLRLVAVALISLATLALSGCATVHGMGEDIESLGRGVQETSRDVAN